MTRQNPFNHTAVLILSLSYIHNMCRTWYSHYDDVIMDAIASPITSLTIVYSTVYSDADQRKHQSSASLAFVWGIHRGPVNSTHKCPVTRKMFPFDDVIMICRSWLFVQNICWQCWNFPNTVNKARFLYCPPIGKLQLYINIQTILL